MPSAAGATGAIRMADAPSAPNAPSAPSAVTAAGVPQLAFSVVNAEAEPRAAVPTLRITLAVENRAGGAVQSVMLTAQIRIDVARRGYDRATQARLADLFGAPERWGETARSLLWTHATTVIPSFDGQTVAALLVPCTYDFEVAVAKYLSGIEDGDIPIELLFTGSVFYTDPEGLLRTARIGWDVETSYRMPVRVWKDIMEHYFPNTAWIRVQRDSFDRLYAYRTEHALHSWEQAIDALVHCADDQATSE